METKGTFSAEAQEAEAMNQEIDTEVENMSPVSKSKEMQLQHKVLSDIKANVPSWQVSALTFEHVALTRLSGLSNACYRVKIHPETASSEN